MQLQRKSHFHRAEFTPGHPQEADRGGRRGRRLPESDLEAFLPDPRAGSSMEVLRDAEWLGARAVHGI